MKFGKQKFISTFPISAFVLCLVDHGHGRTEMRKAESRNPPQPFPFVRLMMVVKIAINSEDSCSNGWVNFNSIAHSSRSSSSQSWLSSASWSAPPSLDTNSSSDRARDASRTCAATDVPERSSCLPRTLTSSRAFGNLTYKRMAPAAKAFVRFLNSSVSRPFISDFCFQLSTFLLCLVAFHFLFSVFPISDFCFLLWFSAVCFPWPVKSSAREVFNYFTGLFSTFLSGVGDP